MSKDKRKILEKETFKDGSAIVTYLGGTKAILESSLAKPAALRQEKPVIYREPLARRSNYGE